MVKHIIDIPKKTNDRIKHLKIDHDLSNVSSVVIFLVTQYEKEV